MIVTNDCDLSIDQNNHNYHYDHNRAVLLRAAGVGTESPTSPFISVTVSEYITFRLCALRICALPEQVNSLACLKYAWCFCTFHLWLKKNPACMGLDVL